MPALSCSSLSHHKNIHTHTHTHTDHLNIEAQLFYIHHLTRMFDVKIRLIRIKTLEKAPQNWTTIQPIYEKQNFPTEMLFLLKVPPVLPWSLYSLSNKRNSGTEKREKPDACSGMLVDI